MTAGVVVDNHAARNHSGVRAIQLFIDVWNDRCAMFVCT